MKKGKMKKIFLIKKEKLCAKTRKIATKSKTIKNLSTADFI